jgi:hypothetical protein
MRSRMKIAPRLTKMVELHAPRKVGPSSAFVECSRHELRALKACARHLERLELFAAGTIGGAGLIKKDLFHEFPVIARAHHLLARLEKVSR